MNELKQRWLTFCRKNHLCDGIKAISVWELVAEEAWERLHKLYSESHRAHHNWKHIADCLAEFDHVKDMVNNPIAVELAIWFHDVIYDVHRNDNEEKSVTLAKQLLSNLIAPQELLEVDILVMATLHVDPPTMHDAKVMVDIDLSKWGKSKSEYDEYEVNIRKEYDWVPKEVFCEKRAETLQTFLDRPHIYYTEYFQDRYEDRAQENVQRAINNLKGE